MILNGKKIKICPTILIVDIRFQFYLQNGNKGLEDLVIFTDGNLLQIHIFTAYYVPAAH